VPDFQDLNASVPVMVEDADGTVLTNEVDFSVCTSDKLAVVCQSFGVEVSEVNVFSEDQHAFVAMYVVLPAKGLLKIID